jgi:prepilin-type N-terminal cleavage/methylation domain-containing protein
LDYAKTLSIDPDQARKMKSQPANANHLSSFSGGAVGDARARALSGGFTLIELILVMTILTIAISITAPALANFFRGRSLDSEARRLLALTRLGQSRAVSEGLPTQLWIDSARGACGLEADTSYETTDSHAVDFTMDKDLQIETSNTVSDNNGQSTAAPAFGAMNSAAANGNHSNLPHIRFLPDGSIGEGSPQTIRLVGRDGFSISIVISRSHLSYEIPARKN